MRHRYLAAMLLVALTNCKKEGFTPDPKNVAEGKYIQGTTEYLKGNFDEALARFAEVEKYTPDDPRLPVAIGETYLSQGKLSDALKQFLKASQLDPRRATTWSRIGFIRAQKGELAEAKVALQKAIALNAKDFNAHEQLAEIQLKENNSDGAVASYKSAAQNSPPAQQAELYLKAVEILRKQQRTQEAIALLLETETSGLKSADLESTLGELWVREGKLEDADTAYRAAAALATRDPGFWELVGEIETRRGRFQEAEAAYRESIRVKDRTIVHIQLAKLHVARKETAAAKEELNLALNAGANTSKDEPAEPLQDTLELVDLLEALDRKSDALKLLTVLSAEPDGSHNAELQQHTAKLAAGLGAKEAVLNACARLALLKPKAKCP